MTLNNSIEARIEAIAEAIKRRAIEQETPVDDLSRSLYDMGRELAALDEQGKTELLEAMNMPSEDGTMGLNLNVDDLEQFISDLSKG